jgi:hypothetical protein
VASRRKRGGLVSPRAVPRFHRDRRHPSSPGRGRDRSCDDDDKDPYPRHNRGTKTCSAGRDREGGREGDRWQFDSRGCSFPGLRGGLDDPQEDHPDPRESLQNMDSLLQAGRIPCFRLLSRRQLALAQQRERQDPGDLAVERPRPSTHPCLALRGAVSSTPLTLEGQNRQGTFRNAGPSSASVRREPVSCVVPPTNLWRETSYAIGDEIA